MKQLCSRAIIIGLDGAGNAPRDCATPCMDTVFDRGVVSYTARTSFPSSSGECWGSLFHGVGPEKHGLDNAMVGSRRYPEDSPYPSFMKLARERWPDCALASFSNWAPINHGIIEGSCGCHLESMEDDALADNVVSYIGSHDPRILFVQMDHVDHAGHAYGYWTPEYYAQVRQNDALIGRILGALEARGMLQDSLVILCADHGGGGADPRSHGSADARDMTIFWGCSGPGIRRGQVITDAVNIKDTAAVVARALGLEIPAGWDCRVPEGIFED
ncbi:MAG: alkaline phosphatase family protein [Anaerolineae bacterium]